MPDIPVPGRPLNLALIGTGAGHDSTGDVWTGLHADTPTGRIAYESPLRTHVKCG